MVLFFWGTSVVTTADSEGSLKLREEEREGDRDLHKQRARGEFSSSFFRAPPPPLGGVVLLSSHHQDEVFVLILVFSRLRLLPFFPCTVFLIEVEVEVSVVFVFLLA